jgi:hypothetical protein
MLPTSDPDMLRGSLASARLRRVVAWTAERQGELASNWNRCPNGQTSQEDLRMSEVLDNVITAAVANPKTHAVAVSWASGDTTVNRFDHLIGKGVFARMADPTVFMQVAIGEHGRSLGWPGEIDFCADALGFEAHPADVQRYSQHTAS